MLSVVVKQKVRHKWFIVSILIQLQSNSNTSTTCLVITISKATCKYLSIYERKCLNYCMYLIVLRILLQGKCYSLIRVSTINVNLDRAYNLFNYNVFFSFIQVYKPSWVTCRKRQKFKKKVDNSLNEESSSTHEKHVSLLTFITFQSTGKILQNIINQTKLIDTEIL